MKNIFIYFILFLLLSQSIVYSKELPTQKDTTQTVEKDTVNINLYKLLYENAKETNNELIDTIHWVIVIMVTFFIAIVGTQIFFNYRINKQEIENIRNDMASNFLKLKSQNILDFKNEKDSNKKELNDNIQKNLNEINDKINSFFTDKSKIIDAYHDTNEKSIEQIKSYVIDQIRNVQIDINKNTGDLWTLKGVKSNAISKFVSTVLLLKEMNRETKYVLDDIIEILDELKEIHESDYEELEKLLPEIPEEYQERKARIEGGFRDKPIYKFVKSAPTELGLPFTKIYTKK